jgi:hypothetical protein
MDSQTDRVAVGDLDNDGDPDLVLSDWQTNYMAFYMNNGTGAFSLSQEIMSFLPLGPQWEDILLGDMNNDKLLDVVEVRYASRELRVTMNRGDEGFADPVYYQTTGFPTGLALADLDGDGDLDYVYPDIKSSSVRVMWNEGDGTPQSRTGLFSTTEVSFGLIVDDFNNDGIPDVAVSGKQHDEVAVHLNEGAFSMLKPSLYEVDNDPEQMISGDFTGDGHVDIITVNTGWDVSSLSMLRGNGDGSFLPQVSVQLSSKPDYASPVDIDSDGDLDIIATYFYTPQSPMYSVVILENDGHGNFQEPEMHATPDAGFSHFAHGDFDGNSTPDIVAMTWEEDPVTFGVYLNPCAPECAADLNDDGVLDFFDVSAFLAGFTDTDPVADFNGDGHFTFFDVSAFLVSYQNGCS